MNLPDIDQMHPQEEPKQFSKCYHCGSEINIGDEYIDHVDFDFCDLKCMTDSYIKTGLAKRVVAGDGR